MKKISIYLLFFLTVWLISCSNKKNGVVNQKVNDSTEDFTANGNNGIVTDDEHFDNPETSKLNSEGIEYAEKGDLNNARKKFKEGLSREPNNVTLLNNMGNVELGEDNYEEAIKYYKQAIKIDSTYYKAYNNYGLTLIRTEKYNESVSINNYVIEHSKTRTSLASAYYNNAICYSNLGNKADYTTSIDSAKYYFSDNKPVLDQIADFEQTVKF